MCDQCCCDNKKGFMGGLVLGSVLVGGLYFLFSTPKGKKIQKELHNLIDDLEEKGQELTDKAKEISHDLREEAKEKITESKGIAKTEVTQKLDQALDAIETIQEKGQELTESIHNDLRHHFFKNTPKK